MTTMTALQDTGSRKTYKTAANAITAIEKAGLAGRRWLIAVANDGRFFPVFVGHDNVDVIHAGFSVVG